MTKKKSSQSKEIVWNLVNSLLAGGLVFFGSVLNGGLSWVGVGAALVASVIVAITKFSEYWKGEQSEYCKCLGNFI